MRREPTRPTAAPSTTRFASAPTSTASRSVRPRITDYTVFAYLADVIVWPERRGHGLGKRLVQALLDHPDMKTVSHWSLTTSDAHSLYQKFGFRAEGRYMRLDRS
ncbi:GNAT family N-acetyltransferase [Mesorhizobium sp. CA4]|uniref:GNAT family N-acetyltransferase n=1 Tax=Mesorhizobium sp. CA4 TaxID=588499 RepID=UPI00296237A9|nr:GNAT family N-acetyltransferase [Mesorhizobium sp. CA4]